MATRPAHVPATYCLVSPACCRRCGSIPAFLTGQSKSHFIPDFAEIFFAEAMHIFEGYICGELFPALVTLASTLDVACPIRLIHDVFFNRDGGSAAHAA